MMQEEIKKLIRESLKNLGIDAREVSFEHPDEISHGDFSTSVALVYAKELKTKPRELSEKIVRYIVQNKPHEIEKVEVAGPGFINFYLSREFFTESVGGILRQAQNFGKNEVLAGKKVMVEYTDPNPFKEFHIGHLMSNAVGESISRIVQFHDAEVKRACYQGDVGLHVAKAIWGMEKDQDQIQQWRYTHTLDKHPIELLGKWYAEGNHAYEVNEKNKKAIQDINEIIYKIISNQETKDPRKILISNLYKYGREISLSYFETIYKKLGTEFNNYFFESETGEFGKKVVEEFLGRGVFEKSQNAIIFPGEKHGLHTRVFINSQGLPTYEAKELGLAKIKYDAYKYDSSIVITGNEVNDYFKVLLCALNLVFPELAKKTKHLSHGMLRLPTGKMSSRTGNVITAEGLIASVEAMVHKKLEERELETAEKNKIAGIVAIGAIKYSILKQAIGSDIIYDFDKSISFEGDSGPYLQYSYVRAKSVLAKAESSEVEPWIGKKVRPRKDSIPEEVSLLEKLLYRFPEVVERAGRDFAPHLIATFLVELASSFNSYYAKNQIVNAGDPTSAYKVALTSTFATTLKNGLWLLGIQVPEHM